MLADPGNQGRRVGIYLLGGHYPAETALAALDAQLDLVLGPAGPGDGAPVG